MTPDASIIIVSFNTRDLTLKCLKTLFTNQEKVSFEVIVVDNASKDQTVEAVSKEFPLVHIEAMTENLGFGAANNWGARKAKGRYLVLLNSDAFLDSGSLSQAVEKMDKYPTVGLAGGKLTGEDGSWQPSARQFPSLLNHFFIISGLSVRFPKSTIFSKMDRPWADPDIPVQSDWVPGAFCIIRKQLFDQIQGFDERFFLYSEEVDLCKRVKEAGYEVWYWPEIKIIHLEGKSAEKVSSQSKNDVGKQLNKWRAYSEYLYYNKHDGKGVAFLHYGMESLFLWLREIKNRIVGNQDKSRILQTQRKILQQAWHDTNGGNISPHRPWK